MQNRFEMLVENEDIENWANWKKTGMTERKKYLKKLGNGLIKGRLLQAREIKQQVKKKIKKLPRNIINR